MSAPPVDTKMERATIHARFFFNEAHVPIYTPTRQERLQAIEAAAMLIQAEVLNDAINGQNELAVALMTATDHTGTILPDAMMSALTVLRQLANPQAPVKLDG